MEKFKPFIILSLIHIQMCIRDSAKTTDATILERKKYYLLEKLRENNSEIEKCKKLIDVVVNILPEWKLEYILSLIHISQESVWSFC